MIPAEPRDLEWQRRYEENDTPWDRGAPAPALVRFLQRGLISGHVLVPGCGRGHEVRAIGSQPGCSVTGLDLSATAIEDAEEIAIQPAAGATVDFTVGDFFQLPAERQGSFDWLVEHTCFCAIDPEQRPDYIRAAAGALRPGGKFFGIFYLDPDTKTGPPFPVSKEELSELFAPHFDLIEEWMPEKSFSGRENREWVRLLQKR